MIRPHTIPDGPLTVDRILEECEALAADYKTEADKMFDSDDEILQTHFSMCRRVQQQYEGLARWIERHR